MKLDVALLQLSPPDKHGYCTLGTSVDAALAAARAAAPSSPRSTTRCRARSGTRWCRSTRHAFTTRPPAARARSPRQTGRRGTPSASTSPLVPDGATLQMGIGAIPDAVLRRLGDKHDLGIHTEMFSDGVIDLVEAAW
jgi:4-hydroxybutyrate CoA-transferase